MKRPPLLKFREFIKFIHSSGTALLKCFDKSAPSNDNQVSIMCNSNLFNVQAIPYLNNRFIFCNIYKIRRAYYKILRNCDIPTILSSKRLVNIYRYEEALNTFPFLCIDHESFGFHNFHYVLLSKPFQLVHTYVNKVEKSKANNHKKSSAIAFRRVKNINTQSKPKEETPESIYSSVKLNPTIKKLEINNGVASPLKSHFSTHSNIQLKKGLPTFTFAAQHSRAQSKAKSRKPTLFVIPSITNEEWKELKKGKPSTISNYGINENINSCVESEESLMKQADMWGEKKSEGLGEMESQFLGELSVSSLQSVYKPQLNSLSISSQLQIKGNGNIEICSPIDKSHYLAFP